MRIGWNERIDHRNEFRMKMVFIEMYWGILLCNASLRGLDSRGIVVAC